MKCLLLLGLLAVVAFAEEARARRCSVHSFPCLQISEQGQEVLSKIESLKAEEVSTLEGLDDEEERDEVEEALDNKEEEEEDAAESQDDAIEEADSDDEESEDEETDVAEVEDGEVEAVEENQEVEEHTRAKRAAKKAVAKRGGKKISVSVA